MTKEEIKKQIAECEEKLKSLREELDKPEYGGKRWKPMAHGSYYLLSAIGGIHGNLFDSEYDLSAYLQGNCFKTKEEAEFEAERRRVIAELSDFAEGDDAAWDKNAEHWYIYYSFYTKGIVYESWHLWKTPTLLFSSKEAAEAAVKAVGEERVKKYYLRVKEG